MTRCTKTIYKRDTYRVDRSAGCKSGFSMHYTKTQCTRQALPGSEHCWQHDALRADRRMERAHEKRLVEWRRKRDAEVARLGNQS